MLWVGISCTGHHRLAFAVLTSSECLPRGSHVILGHGALETMESMPGTGSPKCLASFLSTNIHLCRLGGRNDLIESVTLKSHPWARLHHCSHSVMCVREQSYQTLCDLWTVPRQAPLSLWFPKQENCSGLPFPHPGGLTDPGDWTRVSWVSCVGRQIDTLPLNHQGSPFPF